MFCVLLQVNDLIQAGTLCSGDDISINSISPLFLTANGNQVLACF